VARVQFFGNGDAPPQAVISDLTEVLKDALVEELREELFLPSDP
jgi:hypothetical protein